MILASGPWTVADRPVLLDDGVDRIVTVTVNTPEIGDVRILLTPERALLLAADLRTVVEGRRRT